MPWWARKHRGCGWRRPCGFCSLRVTGTAMCWCWWTACPASVMWWSRWACRVPRSASFAAYRNDAADAELVAQAAAEQRVVLTQDRGLLRRRALRAGAYVRGGRTDDQLADVLDRFCPVLAPWTRCPACNGHLEPVAKVHVQHLLQPGTRRTYTQFSQCQACGQVYWRGAHARRLQAIVAGARP